MKTLLRYVICALATTLFLGTATAEDSKRLALKFGNLGASTGDLYQYLAVEKGIFQKHGLDIEFVEFLQGGPEATAAAASGRIDMGSAGTPVLIAISRGFPLRVVGSPARRGQPFILVGRPEVKSIAELKGKLVGVGSVGGGSSEALRVILKANGIREEDVKTIAFGTGPNGYLSLKSGKLAAAILAEPNASKAELDGVGKVLAEADHYFDHYQHSYVFATQKFIKTHPEAIRAYFRANREALQYARTHQDELIALGKKKLALDEKTLKTVFAREIPKWDDNPDVDPQSLLNAIAAVKSVGDINKDYEPVITQIVVSGLNK